MKHSTKLFLEVLGEATLEMYDGEPSNEFRRGVKATINAAKYWFESMRIDAIEVNPEE